MQFDHIHPTFLPFSPLRSTLTFLPPLSVKITHQEFNLCCSDTQGCAAHILEWSQAARTQHPLQNWLFLLLRKSLPVHGSSVRSGAHERPRLAGWLALSRSGLPQVTTAHEGRNPAISSRHCVTLVLLNFWLLKSFHPSLHDSPRASAQDVLEMSHL